MSMPVAGPQAQREPDLASVVGQDHVRISADGAVLAAPANVQEIADILRFADARGLTVTPMGSGSKMGWGHPVKPDIVLSLERMGLLREHTWADMTCTVEAGAPWAAMQSELRRHGQMVALDPLWPERATIGGIVAVNDSGGLRLKYGGLRDLIIGMTVVLADGTIARTGGKVVKNVAGYDLHKLMTGSFGTLGVIAEVNFRLHPVEFHTLDYTVVAPDPTPLTEPMRALLDSEMTPSRVQIRVGSQGCCLDLRIAARPECMEQYAARVRAIFAAMEIQAAEETVWCARQDLFGDRTAVILKVSVLPADLCRTCAELQPLLGPSLRLSCVAQATGLITVALQGAEDAVISAAQSLRARLRVSGGHVVVLQLPEALRGSLDVWEADGSALPLMREIKRQFDPKRTLNPGRFVGSI